VQTGGDGWGEEQAAPSMLLAAAAAAVDSDDCDGCDGRASDHGQRSSSQKESPTRGCLSSAIIHTGNRERPGAGENPPPPANPARHHLASPHFPFKRHYLAAFLTLPRTCAVMLRALVRAYAMRLFRSCIRTDINRCITYATAHTHSNSTHKHAHPQNVNTRARAQRLRLASWSLCPRPGWALLLGLLYAHTSSTHSNEGHTHSLIHSLTHALTHSRTHALTHPSLAPSPYLTSPHLTALHLTSPHSLTHSLIHPISRSPTHCFV
jgi:hypothetical protein